MRVKLVGKGTVKGLDWGSDINLMIVPIDAERQIDHIPVTLVIDPESTDLDPIIILEVPDA